MQIWLLAIDKKYCSYEELKYRKVLAQGWPNIGGLSHFLPVKNENKFKEIIKSFVEYFYSGEKHKVDSIILNLTKFSKGDYVICCEGETVKGIAKITEELSYYYDNSKLYEYAQTVYPVKKWKDVKMGHKIKIKSRGPNGIQKYGGNKLDVTSLFDSL